MCLIVLGDNVVYIVTSGSKEQSDKVRADWEKLHHGLVEFNVALYDRLYREELSLPFDITFEEELMLLHDRYGVRLQSNDEFIGAILKVRERYDKVRKKIPHFVTWAEKHGCTVEETGRVLYI